MSGPATLQVRVAAKRTEAQDICSLELVAADGGALPAFAAGAHIDMHLPNGLVRQYSLCNAPSETHRYVIGVLRDAASRGGSVAVHELVAEGSVLTISAPRNLFPLDSAAPHHLLLAGGIGITPMLAMAEHLAATGGAFTLHHCNRSQARTAFVDRLGAAPFAAHAHHHFDDGDAAQKLDIAATLQSAPAGTHLYVCGPQGLMDADIPMSCEQGVCGTCLTRVKAGTPDHRDQYLMPEEQAANDQFLPCCSRSKSGRLVLDL
jgi:vanillate O-demethylase ferredoxin subunit